MKVSFDLDGGWHDRPEVFLEIAEGLRMRGHTVGILTGHAVESETGDRERLKRDGFLPDFYIGRDPIAMQKFVLSWKAEIIVQHMIDMHFDDDAPQILRFLNGHRAFLIKTPHLSNLAKF